MRHNKNGPKLPDMLLGIKTPLIARLVIKEKINRMGVGIVSIIPKDGKVVISTVDNRGIEKFTVNYEEILEFLIIMKHELFIENFEIKKGRLIKKHKRRK